jgi:hypothetical protein
LGLVELGDSPEVFQAGSGQVLFGLDVFENDADGEFFPLLSEAQSFFRRRQRALGSGKLVTERLPAYDRFHNLAGDVVAQFFDAELGSFQAGF